MFLYANTCDVDYKRGGHYFVVFFCAVVQISTASSTQDTESSNKRKHIVLVCVNPLYPYTA